jgi:hypothetical protein
VVSFKILPLVVVVATATISATGAAYVTRRQSCAALAHRADENFEKFLGDPLPTTGYWGW